MIPLKKKKNNYEHRMNDSHNQCTSLSDYLIRNQYD
jgi:hypothetical protein